jgi:uncharacterized protein (TIGR02421 family)
MSTGQEPEFEYRPLPDLEDLEDRLAEVKPEDAQDAGVANMLEGLVKDLNLRIEMFRSRGTETFFLTSVEMFGHVDTPTLDLANRILSQNPSSDSHDVTVDAATFAEAARAEVEHYRSLYPEMTTTVDLSETRPGVMVEAGNVHIGVDTRIAKSRVKPLLQHEVGTHVVTYANGRAQPLQMLSLGLAGYDELQEALGVLSEHLSGGVPPARLRILAYRVLAADARSGGASFKECYDNLAGLGCAPNLAFSTTMRAYRSGGMTKDVIYLRGLSRLLDHLASGGELAPLFIGKISFDTIPLVGELKARGVLVDPPLQPRFLGDEDAKRHLARIQEGKGMSDIGGIAA